tara:strand:+ start:670 stop:1302 length:633 start_codon:yes stop_codon:yes gene_type:complete
MKNKQLTFTPEQVELAAKLTLLQRNFIIEYIKPSVTQRQAIKAAGSKAKSDGALDNVASQFFNKIQVRAFYDSLMETKTVSSIMERDEALTILSNNARVKMSDVADFGFRKVGVDDKGNDIMESVWTMKNGEDIDPAIASCIKSVTMTKNGPKIELHDQQGAIKQLTDLQGWSAPKKTELTGAGGEALQLNANVTAPEIASALAGLMDKL